jgi:hypothetical protein
MTDWQIYNILLRPKKPMRGDEIEYPQEGDLTIQEAVNKALSQKGLPPTDIGPPLGVPAMTKERWLAEKLTEGGN